MLEKPSNIVGVTEQKGQPEARLNLQKIQHRIMSWPSRMTVWIFTDKPVNGKGVLVIGDKRLFVRDKISVEGVPSDKQEAVAASIAKECDGAVAYLIEPYVAAAR